MKKTAAIILTVCLVFLSSCAKSGETKKEAKEQTPKTQTSEIKDMNGVWLSCFELDGMVKGGDFENVFVAAAEKMRDFGITDLFLHTVPYCDCIYKSDYYPLRKGYENTDVFAKIIEICHERDIRVHAWINPYRVKVGSIDTADLSENSPAVKWLMDNNIENAYSVCLYGGIYLNPAAANVRKLIIDGIRECLTKYDVDGIHFDDYFYPTTDAEFDKECYERYCFETENPLSLAEYRTNAVNSLISGVYTAVKFINKDVVFSVSPAAGIERNKNEYFADIGAWCKNGLLDIIIPQLYFGFEYPDKKYCFENLLAEWEKLTENTPVRLAVGLAAYKIGTTQSPDCIEWANGEEVLTRETEICQNDRKVLGKVYFSYGSLFADSETCVSVRNRLKLT